MRVSDSVHRLTASRGGSAGPPNFYLVLGKETALIDSGYGEEEGKAVLGYLKELGDPSLSYVVVTHPHPDHMGGASWLRKATGARVVAHPISLTEDSRWGRLEAVDIAGEDGVVLDLGKIHLEMVHTPGHSPAHLCVYLREKKLLFTGDTVLGLGTTAIPPPPSGDIGLYIRSLRRLLDYDLKMLCPGHGPVVHEPYRKLKELIQHRLEREEQILGLLSKGLGKVEELVQEIYPELEERLRQMAEGQVLAHLAKLEKEGRVTASSGAYSLKSKNA